MAFQISGFKPDFVFLGKWGKFPMEAGLHDLVSKVMGGKGFILSRSKGLKVIFHSGKVGVRDDGGKGMRFEAHHEKEQRLASDQVGAVVVHEFCVEDHLRP